MSMSRTSKIRTDISGINQSTANILSNVGEGMDWKMYPSRYNAFIEQRSIYMESKSINFSAGASRTFGIPNAYPLRFNHYPDDDTVGIDLRISSSSSSDTNLVINIRGLDKDWNDQTVSIALDGADSQTVVVVPDVSGNKWMRINKMWIESGFTNGADQDDGAFETNVGDIYVYDVASVVVSGVPQTKMLNAIVATCLNSTMGTFSVARNTNFHYIRGNVYTDATTAKPITIQELGFFNWNEARDGSGQRNAYQVGNYGISGNTSYGFQAAAGWGEFSDIQLRINNDVGTNKCVLYYEYMITDSRIDKNNSQQTPQQDTTAP